MQSETLLCFDYGERHIGVAVGQTITATATPLEIIGPRNNKPDWNRISALIEQWQPNALVVGIPVMLDDSRQAMTDAAERFARQLEGRYQLPVHHADERLSSYEARRRIKDVKNLDAVAAQIILEGWLHEYSKISLPDVTMPDNEH